MLEELGLSYNLKVFRRGKDMQADQELKKIHPLGKSPVISVETPDTSKPIVLAESGAIVEFLSDHFGAWLIPKRYDDGKEGQIGGESESWQRYRFFMHYAEGSLMSLILVALVTNSMLPFLLRIHFFPNDPVAMRNSCLLLTDLLFCFIVIKTSPVPFFIRPVTNRVAGKIQDGFLGHNFDTHFAFLEGQMKSSPDGGQYLCGTELTGADVLMSFPLEKAKERGMINKTQHPSLCSYIDRLTERDAYKKALAKIEEQEKPPTSSL